MVIVDPFTALSAIVGGVRLGWWIVKRLRGKKKKENDIRRAESSLSEKLQNVLAALEAHQKLAQFHVRSFAKRDGKPLKCQILTLEISHKRLQNILSQAERSLFNELKKIEDYGKLVLNLAEYGDLNRAASRVKTATIEVIIDLFQRKAQADPIRRPLAITNVEENCYSSERVLASGDRYTGHWRVVNDRFIAPEGWGKRKYRTGGTYEGAWRNGKRHGYGERSWSDGTTYYGDWKDDKKDGKGEERYKSGTKYDGYWKDNKRCGYGRLICSDGTEYMGYWKDDCRHGDDGTNKWADGRRYTGSWAHGKRNGQGTMRWADGCEYKGEWRRDVMEGFGVYTKPWGKTDMGTWRNNKLVPVGPSKAGNRQERHIASEGGCQPSVPRRGLPQFGAGR